MPGYCSSSASRGIRPPANAHIAFTLFSAILDDANTKGGPDAGFTPVGSFQWRRLTGVGVVSNWGHIDVRSKFGASAALAGGAAVAIAMLRIGAAHADNGTDEINGWTVTPTGGSDSTTVLGLPVTLPAATLSDPSNSLGLGTAPIAGEFDSVPATPLSSIGSNDLFTTLLSTIGLPGSLSIQDNWLPGIEEVFVATGEPTNNSLALLVPAIDGDQVVDLFNHSRGDAPPLFNPDATGPIDVGGLELASPQDGALLSDLFDAVFLGDTADWGKTATLFDDWLGTDPSSATDAVDPSNVLPDFGF